MITDQSNILLNIFTHYLMFVGLKSLLFYAYDNLKSPIMLLKSVLLEYFVPQLRISLKERYGSWAVITGATDGIGKAYAKELASKGINIVLISRSQQKLNTTASEIESDYQVQTKSIVADFSQGQSVYDHIKTELIGIKVGILVNNVGQMYDYPQEFSNVPEQKIWNMVLLNIGATAMMSRLLIEHMKTNGKGAIVNISSITQNSPGPYFTMYAASKIFVKYFTIALQWELKSTNITVQLLNPGFIATELTKFSKDLKSAGFIVADLRDFVSTAVFTLGKSDETSGSVYHGIQFAISALAPQRIITFIAMLIAKMWNRQYLKAS